MENKIKNQARDLYKQEMILQDVRKAIRGQNRFFKEAEKTDEKSCNIEDIDSHYAEAKQKYRDLKENFRAEDHILKEQHQKVQMLKERCRKIKDYIHEKKRLESESGIKQTISQKDLEDAKQHIGELENKKNQLIEKYKEKVHIHEKLAEYLKQDIKVLNLRAKEKEDEFRMVSLKIKEIHRVPNNSIIKNVGKSQQRSKPTEQYYTPSRKTTKFGEKKNKQRSNSSRGGAGVSISQNNPTSGKEFESNEKPKSRLNNFIENNQVNEVEDEYEIDFSMTEVKKVKDQLDQSGGNLNNNDNKIKGNFLSSETTNIANNLTVSTADKPNDFQAPVNKPVSSKPSFMIKRKI